MKYYIVLNACQKDIHIQHRETFGFFKEFYKDKTYEAIIFYSKKEIIENLSFDKKWLNLTTFIEVENQRSEIFLKVLENLYSDKKDSIYIFPSNLWGQDICTRFSFRMQGSGINNIISITNNKVEKLTYSNNMLSSFRMNKLPYCFTLAKGLYEESMINNPPESMYIKWKSEEKQGKILDFIEKTKAEDLSTSSFVVICGKGIDSKEKIQRAKEITEKIGAKFGITRPVAMLAWDKINNIVGISGHICKSEICFVLGASGAGAFLAGVEKSKWILSVNTDEDAMMNECSDVVILEDGLEFLEKFSRKFEVRGNNGKI